jgi:hypothetical protein
VARKLVMMEQDLERAEERAEQGDSYVNYKRLRQKRFRNE